MSRPKLERKYPKEVIWLLKNKSVLSFNKIEEKLNLPQSILWKVCTGKCGLKEDHWPKIVKFVRILCKIS